MLKFKICVLLIYSAAKWAPIMCSNALNSRGKPVVSPMRGSPTFDIDKKNRNGANLKLRHALRAGGVKTLG